MKTWCKIEKSKITFSLDAPVGNSTKIRNMYDFISSSNNIYSDSDFAFNEDDDIYNQVISAINYGLEIDEIINILAKKLNLKSQEVLDIIKNQMIEQNFIQENKDGTYQLFYKNK